VTHEHTVPPHTDETSALSTLHTDIFRSACTPGALLFNTSKCRKQYTDQQCMILLKQQHPNVHTCVSLSDGARRYLEVYITRENDKNDMANIGLKFPDSKLQVFPCIAIDDTANILTLKLSHLPMLLNNQVLIGIKQSLEIFGIILDVGITTEANMGFFMGTGYTVINLFQPVDTPADKQVQQLSHQISSCESTTEFFRATWINIPTWCQYCHKEGHTKFDCALSKARSLCYSCHQQGHRSFECPRRNQPIRPNKKLPRKSYQTKNTTPQKISDDTDDDSSDFDYKAPSNESSEDPSDGMSISSDDHSISKEEVHQREQ
ncbi:MAG: hypothetical protein EXX96DRAFT_638185, partial [Benjaminiella poitrasii]